MRALVVGASGLVGGALLRHLGADAVGTYRRRLRPGLRRLAAEDRSALAALIAESRPAVIFFPAGDPNVDWCEREPAAAEAANLRPLRAAIATAAGIPLVAYSTDYVFDGQSGPYDEEDPRRPLSVYGRLKVVLEDEVLASGGTVIRPTVVYGQEPESPKNFVLRLISSLRRGERVRVPNDQVANPTYVEDLAVASIEIARTGEGGLWHVAGADLLARDAFARLIAESFGLDSTLVEGVPTSALDQLAARPLRGGLRCDRYAARFARSPVRPVRAALAHLRETLEEPPG